MKRHPPTTIIKTLTRRHPPTTIIKTLTRRQSAAAQQDANNKEGTPTNPKSDGEGTPQMMQKSQTDQTGEQKANALTPTQEPTDNKPNSKQSLTTDSDQPLSAEKQAEQEWLGKINPDAGRVLRYRLLKQYEEQR